MGYLYWPHTQPPYTPYTYIEDRVTPLTHKSIMDGLARDVGLLEHNINTTNLFASGWLHPVISGYFRNIDTNYLYAHNINAGIMELEDVKEANIRSLKVTNELIFNESILKNNNITLKDTFTGPSGFSLSSASFSYNPIYISGYLYDYYMNKDLFIFNGGLFTNFTSNNIIIVEESIIIENHVSSFTPSGLLPEASIKWNSALGHDHIINKINADSIIDSDIVFENDVIINNNNSYIKLMEGLVDFNSIQEELEYNDLNFYELVSTKDGVYTCDEPELTGNIKDLDIGLYPMISYDNKLYAISNISPTGSSNRSDVYLYNTSDLINWSGVLISGNFRPSASGTATLDDLLVNNGLLYYLWNYRVDDDNHCMVGWFDEETLKPSGLLFSSGTFAHGSSRYGLGLSSINDKVTVYGYEYPHLKSDGIPQWDKYCSYWKDDSSTESSTELCDTTEQDISYSGGLYKYSFPFIEHYIEPYPTESMFFLDGTYEGREPYLTDEVNGDVYNKLIPYGSNGYFASFFGNGFSEITAILPTYVNYHNGQRGYYVKNNLYGFDKADLIDLYNTNPVLVFGNSTINVNTSDGGNIFGGCLPLVIDIDDRLFNISGSYPLVLSSGNASYSPTFLHGSISLLDETTLFRIPNTEYTAASDPDRLNQSNLFNQFQNNIGRLWFDNTILYDDLINRGELINLCPYKPGYLTFPFAGSGSVYYKHTTDENETKLNYTSSLTDSNGVIIPPLTFDNHRNYPIYSERVQKEGFWRDKTFDWYYVQNGVYQEFGEGTVSLEYKDGAYPNVYYYITASGFTLQDKWVGIEDSLTIYTSDTPNFTLQSIITDVSGVISGKYVIGNQLENLNYVVSSGDIRTVPSGSYPKTYYYMRPRKPVQHNGIIYAILEYNTGYVYLGPNGTEYTDDGVMYTDLIKYGNTLYGVGIETKDNGESYTIVISKIRRNSSVKNNITSAYKGSKTTPKFVIHNGLLYVGLGAGRFLVKKPSHINLSITSNL